MKCKYVTKGQCQLKDWFESLRCPECSSKKVHLCKGGTCLVSDLRINFICEDCCNEW